MIDNGQCVAPHHLFNFGSVVLAHGLFALNSDEVIIANTSNGLWAKKPSQTIDSYLLYFFEFIKNTEITEMWKKVENSVVDVNGQVLGTEAPNSQAAAVVATIPALLNLALELKKSKASDQRKVALGTDLAWAFSHLEPICQSWRVTKKGIFDHANRLVFSFACTTKKVAALIRYAISTLKQVAREFNPLATQY